ncbi:PREDICTED: uncharacterized protein LOC104799754 isoform X3 [Tarenaya hassleriana]|uniref:uncharacterized protein LOC104799754 isoform X3 n=1 Tax=Tarenaya hassleriana TaxID=28532 RepID=UPI00053C7071|nr:PREDICTED: uncharacterized protein LOC104799754 isoform X3 [Tarenaya hassleriana]
MAFAVTAKLFSAAAGSIVSPARSNRSPKRPCFFSVHRTKPWVGLAENWGRRETTPPPLAANGGVGTPEEEGVSLGTMKLPLDTDLARFETLLFQWANSLCQGANLPLPVPLKPLLCCRMPLRRIFYNALVGLIRRANRGNQPSQYMSFDWSGTTASSQANP